MEKIEKRRLSLSKKRNCSHKKPHGFYNERARRNESEDVRKADVATGEGRKESDTKE